MEQNPKPVPAAAGATTTKPTPKPKAMPKPKKAKERGRAVVIELPAHIVSGIDNAARAAGRRPGELFDAIRKQAEDAVAASFDKVTPFMIAASMVEADIAKQREESQKKLDALREKMGTVAPEVK